MPREPLIEQLIVDLVEHRGRLVTGREVGRWGKAGVTLRDWGALKGGATLTSIACAACDDDHLVDLEYDSTAGTWYHYCTWAGIVTVARDDLVTYVLDWDWLVSQLAELLSIQRLEMARLIDGVMWRLGTARLGTRFWTAVLVRDVERNLDAILEQLQRAGRVHPGLLLSSSPTTFSRVALPNDYRWLSLRQLLHADEDELAVRETALMDALRIRQWNGPRRKAGRPGVQEMLLAELRRRAECGEILESVTAEAEYLVDWLRQSPRSTRRSQGRVETVIRDAFRNLKLEQA